MKKVKLKSAVFSCLLMGGLFVFGGSALADNSNSTNNQPSMHQQGPGGELGRKGFGGPMMIGNTEIWQNVLDSLVDEGTLSDDQADEVKNYLDQKAEKSVAGGTYGTQKGNGFLSQAIEKEIITEDEAEAIEKAWQQEREDQKEAPKDRMEEQFSQLVDEGIISQGQADDLQEYLEDSMKNQEESKEDSENRRQPRQNPKAGFLSGAVDKEIITSDELTAIEESWQKSREDQNSEKYSQLVDDGIISQDQADELQGLLEKKDQDNEKSKGFLGDLVDQGTITDDQAEAIMEKLQTVMKSEREQMTEKQFSSLVDDGVITQDQADALLDFMKEQTSQEKKASSEKHQEGFLSAAVDQGVITQDEADAIQEQWQKDRDAKQEEIIDNQLSQLVDDEIISQDESDAMKEFINEQREEQKAQMDQVKDMADEERKAFFEDNKDQRVNILDQMVDKGIITQDQADAMTKKIHIPALF